MKIENILNWKIFTAPKNSSVAKIQFYNQVKNVYNVKFIKKKYFYFSSESARIVKISILYLF